MPVHAHAVIGGAILIHRKTGLVLLAVGLCLASPYPRAAAETVVYSFDALGRLTAACFVEAARRVTYSYDATGNRSTVATTTASCDDPVSDPPPPANQPPVAVNDSSSLQHTTFDTARINVLANDSDPDDDPLTIDSASCDTAGCAVVIDGAFLDIVGTSEGVKVVTYTISDGRGGTDSAQASASFTSSSGCGQVICF